MGGELLVHSWGGVEELEGGLQRYWTRYSWGG